MDFPHRSPTAACNLWALCIKFRLLGQRSRIMVVSGNAIFENTSNQMQSSTKINLFSLKKIPFPEHSHKLRQFINLFM